MADHTMPGEGKMISSGFERTVLLIIIAKTSHQALAQPPYKLCFPNKGNYTTNSTYHTNLKTLISRFLLPINRKGYGFYSSSNGQNNVENVYASGLCRGDVDQKTCHICLSIAADTITQVCPNKKQAILWRNNCTLRYSNRTLYGVMEAAPPFLQASNQNVAPSVVDGFNQELKSLMERLRSEAAAGSSDQQLKFAIGNTTLEGSNSSQTIYGLAQCTPDLSEKDCNDCLVSAFGYIPWYCQGKTGGRVGLDS
uniref:cysteine-rich receptor-like protein kinase 29 n=1 Tax=Fragaria vesca subsp. vesca TaxID=101020 RepID=UPI0005C83F34|nr:PREDICTED: cysteine-rich receptor-like protein kinase 29 [Fragaria vesca subsp. vesca]